MYTAALACLASYHTNLTVWRVHCIAISQQAVHLPTCNSLPLFFSEDSRVVLVLGAEEVTLNVRTMRSNSSMVSWTGTENPLH